MVETITPTRIRELVIISLASDDSLVEQLVLKGGNAIDFWRPREAGKHSRTSFDLDFSIPDDFNDDLDAIKKRMESLIADTFSEHQLRVFDFFFQEQPKLISDLLKDFWGGYFVAFKVITDSEFFRLGGNLEKIRKGAINIRPDQSKKVQIDISKYEYTGEKREMHLDGYKFYIYSPAMIVFEKLRAICQQLTAYKAIVPSHTARPRARDFYDIYLICEIHEIDPNSQDCLVLAGNIFAAKKTPISFIGMIQHESEIHRQDWQNVIDTIGAADRVNLKDFDFYLDFVVKKFGTITSL